MIRKQYTTKQRKFQHLTREKRAQIEILLRQGLPKSKIAKEVGIARSTLYLELARGTVEQVDSELRLYYRYFWDAGQRVYEKNRQNSRPPLKLIPAHDFIAYAEKAMLEDKLSPDVICGRAKREGQFAVTVCTKTLYNYIDQGLLKVRNIDLLLRVKRKQRNEQNHRNKRLYGRSIEERPQEASSREIFGHWEIDTVLGCSESSAALLTIDDRMSRICHIVKIKSRTAEAVEEGLNKLKTMYGDSFSHVFRSITSDNGSEFARLTEQLPETDIYYTHPYSAWERGTNEKQNSLIRRFFPKGTNFDDIPDSAIARVEAWINNLPRKIFGYRSSAEFFQSVRFDIAI